MKKLYFSLLAAAISLTASAADYYLVGGFNRWTLEDAACKFTEKGDGTYELNLNKTLTSGFKINDGTWDNAAANFGSNGSKLVVDEVYNLGSGGASGNIDMDGNVKNPTLVFDPAAATLLVKGQGVAAETAYCLHGNWDGTINWADLTLTEKDGKWVSEEKTVSACNFGIKMMDKASMSQTGWYASAGAAAVTVNSEMPITANGTNFSLAAGTYTFTVDMKAMTILVSSNGENPNPPTPPTPPTVDYSTWYVNVLGDFNEWKDNGLNPDAEGVTCHTNLPIGTSGFKIKIWNGKKDVYYSTGTALPASAPVVIEGDALANMTVEGATAESVYDVTFDCKTNTITVNLVGGGDNPNPGPVVDVPAELYIVGNLEKGMWSPTEACTVKMTKEGDVFTAKGVAFVAPGYFNLITALAPEWPVENGWDLYINGSNRYGAITEGEALTEETPVKFASYLAGVNASDSKSWVVPTSEVTVNKYDITVNFEDGTIKLGKDTSGVEEVEIAEGEAVYYNLQGARVVNPENGIYVKVVNGKAFKVIVK